MRSSLDNIIKLEQDEMWNNKNKPQIDEELYISHIHTDILVVCNIDIPTLFIRFMINVICFTILFEQPYVNVRHNLFL